MYIQCVCVSSSEGVFHFENLISFDTLLFGLIYGILKWLLLLHNYVLSDPGYMMPPQWMHPHVPMPTQCGMETQQMQPQPMSGVLNALCVSPHLSLVLLESCIFHSDQVHTVGVGGKQTSRGGRSYSPGAPQSSTVEKKQSPPTGVKTSSAPAHLPPKIQEHSHNTEVDSWEEIDEAESSQPPSVPDPSSQNLTPTPGGTETELKTDSRSTSSSGRSTPKSQELTLVKEAPSSSASSSSTPDLAKIERKQPSPSLSDKSSGRGEGPVAKGSKRPPPKDEDEKENINIVFIGHVGMFGLEVLVHVHVYSTRSIKD